MHDEKENKVCAECGLNDCQLIRCSECGKPLCDPWCHIDGKCGESCWRGGEILRAVGARKATES